MCQRGHRLPRMGRRNGHTGGWSLSMMEHPWENTLSDCSSAWETSSLHQQGCAKGADISQWLVAKSAPLLRQQGSWLEFHCPLTFSLGHSLDTSFALFHCSYTKGRWTPYWQGLLSSAGLWPWASSLWWRQQHCYRRRSCLSLLKMLVPLTSFIPKWQGQHTRRVSMKKRRKRQREWEKGKVRLKKEREKEGGRGKAR